MFLLAPCASLKMTLRLEWIVRGARPDRTDAGLLKRLAKCGEVDVARDPFDLVLPLHRFHGAFGQRWRQLLLTFEPGGAAADFRWRSTGFRRAGRRQQKPNDPSAAATDAAGDAPSGTALGSGRTMTRNTPESIVATRSLRRIAFLASSWMVRPASARRC